MWEIWERSRKGPVNPIRGIVPGTRTKARAAWLRSQAVHRTKHKLSPCKVTHWSNGASWSNLVTRRNRDSGHLIGARIVRMMRVSSFAWNFGETGRPVPVNLRTNCAYYISQPREIFRRNKKVYVRFSVRLSVNTQTTNTSFEAVISSNASSDGIIEYYTHVSFSNFGYKK